jgi:hypothetical protein
MKDLIEFLEKGDEYVLMRSTNTFFQKKPLDENSKSSIEKHQFCEDTLGLFKN